MSCWQRRSATRIRAIVFINHLVLAAGCARTPFALERLGEAFEAKELGVTHDESTHKWRRYLRGVLVGPKLRVCLMRRFPVLIMVLANPLWAILAWLEHPTSRPDLFANRLRLNGRALFSRQYRMLFQQRMANPNWGDLAFLLAILASTYSGYYQLRVWVRQHFSLMFLLMCSAPAMTGVARLLFVLLSDHFRAGHLAPVPGWPSSLKAFKRHLKQAAVLTAVLRRLHPHVRVNTSAVIFVLISDAECARIFKGGVDLAEVWPRCRRLASRNVRPGTETIMHFEGLACDPKVSEGWADDGRASH